MGLEHLCGGEGQVPSGAPPAPSGDEGRADCTHPGRAGAAGACGAGRDSPRAAYRSPGVWRAGWRGIPSEDPVQPAGNRSPSEKRLLAWARWAVATGEWDTGRPGCPA